MDEVEQTIETYDKIASSYCKKTRLKKYLDWEEQYIRKLLSYCPDKKPRILDAGCGDGRHCLLIDKNGGQSIGIDLSESMIKEAETYYPDGDFRRMNMLVLDFDDAYFDGVWSSGSIYHVTKADARNVIGQFRRILKKGGVLSLNFKLGGGEGLEANPKSYGGSPRYFAYYSKDEMTDMLADFGFYELDARLYPEEIFGDDIVQIWLRLSDV